MGLGACYCSGKWVIPSAIWWQRRLLSMRCLACMLGLVVTLEGKKTWGVFLGLCHGSFLKLDLSQERKEGSRHSWGAGEHEMRWKFLIVTVWELLSLSLSPPFISSIHSLSWVNTHYWGRSNSSFSHCRFPLKSFIVQESEIRREADSKSCPGNVRKALFSLYVTESVAQESMVHSAAGALNRW